MEYIKELMTALLMVGILSISNYLIIMNKQNILLKITDLIQKAEDTVKGSGMGPEKKAIVLAQLEASGIKVKAWMSTAIDNIVKTLNERSAWLVTQADEKLSKKKG